MRVCFFYCKWHLWLQRCLLIFFLDHCTITRSKLLKMEHSTAWQACKHCKSEYFLIYGINIALLNYNYQIYFEYIYLHFYLSPIYRHLARNPFHCDCHINWIVNWLSLNPVETSGARCEGPKRMHKKKLGSLRSEQLKCYGNHNMCF